MIKVLHIITRLDMGGSAQNTLDSCLHLNPSTYAVTLMHGMSHESGMTAEERAVVQQKVSRAKTRGVAFVTQPDLVRRIDMRSDLKTLVAIIRWMRREKPFIVHTHTSKAGLIGRLAAWFSRVPIIIHTPHGHVFYGHFGRIRSTLFWLLEKLTAPMTSRLIALTARERLDYIASGIATARKVVTIHSGVDVERFKEKDGEGNPLWQVADAVRKGTILGFVGWLLPIKGVSVLLKSMAAICAQHPETKLLLVGKGSQEAELKAAASSLGIPRQVVFCGWQSDVERFMRRFDIFVLPSFNEGMGRVLVEAMAAGKPIVASNAGGIPDLVKDGENGILVPPGDEKALAEGILQLIRHPETAATMGQAGRRMASRYTLEAMVTKIEALYADLTQQASGHGRLPLCKDGRH